MSFAKKNKIINTFLLIGTLVCFQNTFGLCLDDIFKRLPHSTIARECPAWDSVASELSIANVALISDHLYKIVNKNIFNNKWDLVVNNISAASPEEALTKTKNLLNTLPKVPLENKYLQGIGSSYTYELCFYSDDVFMYSQNHGFFFGPIAYIS